jgi:hypothetical protein
MIKTAFSVTILHQIAGPRPEIQLANQYRER